MTIIGYCEDDVYVSEYGSVIELSDDEVEPARSQWSSSITHRRRDAEEGYYLRLARPDDFMAKLPVLKIAAPKE
jgi:hypothetical protein